MKKVSKKSYAVAVCLAGVFGIVGIEYFYIGRWAEGLLNLALFGATLYFFFTGNILAALVFFAVDFIHSTVTTIMLLTGNFRDGEGAIICYPGQQLK